MLGMEASGKMKAAMKESSKAMNKADVKIAVLAAIVAIPEPYRAIGKRLHAIIKANPPALSAKLWYEMPAYAKDGRVFCFFRALISLTLPNRLKASIERWGDIVPVVTNNELLVEDGQQRVTASWRG